MFSVKSAYNLIEGLGGMTGSKIFKEIWRWEGVERIRIFLWITFNNKLPTNVWKSSWSLSSLLCAHFNEEAEDVLHILRDCEYARELWTSLLKPQYYAAFFWSSFERVGSSEPD